METAVPNAIASVSSYTKKLNSLETSLKNVTAMVDDLRSKLAKARDLANRVRRIFSTVDLFLLFSLYVRTLG